MSSEIKVGDVCIVVAAPCMAEDGRKYVGMEGTVLRIVEPSIIEQLLFDLPPIGAVLQLSTGEQRGFCMHQLRKKQPPQELGSWKEIARLTNWNPVRDGVTA
jgi:hypothetical protein